MSDILVFLMVIAIYEFVRWTVIDSFKRVRENWRSK